MWVINYIETSSRCFEYFVAGNGVLLAFAHFYIEFNSKKNLFGNPFNKDYMQLGLNDLEAIREVLRLDGCFCRSFY